MLFGRDLLRHTGALWWSFRDAIMSLHSANGHQDIMHAEWLDLINMTVVGDNVVLSSDGHQYYHLWSQWQWGTFSTVRPSLGTPPLNTPLCACVQPTDGVLGQEDVLRRPITPSHMKAGGDQSVVHVQPRSRSESTQPHTAHHTPLKD